jgi:hypothetical protein
MRMWAEILVRTLLSPSWGTKDCGLRTADCGLRFFWQPGLLLRAWPCPVNLRLAEHNYATNSLRF